MQINWIDQPYRNDALEMLQREYAEYSQDDLIKLLDIQQTQLGYQLVGISKEDELIGLLGFCEGHNFSWGHHILIHDFIIAPQWELTGAPSRLIRWLHSHAEKIGCRQIHVNLPVESFRRHKSVLHEGFEISNHHFCLWLSQH